jgi:formylglycine-generating enzyme required for sulfatase activity
MANTWQGSFPYSNTLDDGWERTSPVGAFPADFHGLLDMIGNVWEWTADWWSLPADKPGKNCCSARRAASVVPGDPAAIPRRVLKGGSHLCAPNYCRRYRPAARHAHPVDTSTSHIGFRCVIRP